jgi:hypothetical protein
MDQQMYFEMYGNARVQLCQVIKLSDNQTKLPVQEILTQTFGINLLDVKLPLMIEVFA